MTKLNISFLFIILNIISFNHIQAQTADEILANYFENTGGLENWKKLKNSKMTGKFLQSGMEIPFVNLRKAPNKFITTAYMQSKELVISAYDGKTAWSLNPFAMQTEPTAMSEEEQKEVAEEAVFEDPFIDYQEKGHTVELEGKESIEGTECFKIKLTKKNGRISYYFFETENFVPIMSTRTINIGPEKGGVIETYMSDYQEVGDYIMPYSFVQKYKGETSYSLTADEIEVNLKEEDIPNSKFDFEK